MNGPLDAALVRASLKCSHIDLSINAEEEYNSTHGIEPNGLLEKIKNDIVYNDDLVEGYMHTEIVRKDEEISPYPDVIKTYKLAHESREKMQYYEENPVTVGDQIITLKDVMECGDTEEPLVISTEIIPKVCETQIQNAESKIRGILHDNETIENSMIEILCADETNDTICINDIRTRHNYPHNVPQNVPLPSTEEDMDRILYEKLIEGEKSENVQEMIDDYMLNQVKSSDANAERVSNAIDAADSRVMNLIYKKISESISAGDEDYLSFSAIIEDIETGHIIINRRHRAEDAISVNITDVGPSPNPQRLTRFNYLESEINSSKDVTLAVPREVPYDNFVISRSLKHTECYCMEDVIVNDRCIITKCKHTFHPDCLFRWTENNITCPNCRTDIRVLS